MPTLRAGNTLTSLLILNYDAAGKLGFYLSAGEQIFSLLVSYGAIKLVSLWAKPPLMWLLSHFFLAPRALTQAKMNALLEGSEFEYALSTAYVLFLVFISAFFSTVLPLSLFICAASCLLRYLTERLYFLRIYKQPPMYDSSLISTAVSWHGAHKMSSLSVPSSPPPPCASAGRAWRPWAARHSQGGGQAGGRPATASGARANRIPLQSRRLSCLGTYRYLPLAIVGKLATMYYFYAETRAGNKGVYLAAAATLVGRTVSSPVTLPLHSRSVSVTSPCH